MPVPQAQPAPPAATAPAPAPPRKSPWRTAGEILAVLAITGVLVGVLLEISLRLFAPQISSPIPGLFVADAATRYRLKPNVRIPYHFGDINTVYTTNDQGLREDHTIGAPAPGSTRLLFLGDSFTFGSGVDLDQAFAHRLSGSTAADGSRIESVDAGVPGYGTDNEAAWLQTYGWALQPKIVLVGFFVGNDVKDTMLGLDKTMVDDQGRLVETPQTRQVLDRQASTGLKGWLEQNSHAYVFLRNLAYKVTGRQNKPAPADPAAGLFTGGPYEAITFLRKDPPPEVAAGWDKVTGLLDSMRAAATAHGATLVVVAIPTREQVQDADWATMLQQLGTPESTLTRDLPQQQLAAWSARTGAPLIDLLPAFRAAAQTQPLYFRTDPHCNAAGHALAAQIIQDGLVHLGLFRR
ncbi:MAG TPA: GDSL-type esterase/lipase family protein [Chloroflexia bacterium]|nr:GDSL-type esterase/lipase family protein [Chloroflexia bacterium]